jgi:hypothetical protein
MKLFIFVLILFCNTSFGKNVNDAMNEVFSSSQKNKITANECTLTKKLAVSVLDKIEGKSEIIELLTGTDTIYQTLKLKATKCCLTEDQSYAFIGIENLKLKKEIFKGWLFSRNTTKNGLEDSKFDIILLRCL